MVETPDLKETQTLGMRVLKTLFLKNKKQNIHNKGQRSHQYKLPQQTCKT